MPDKKNSIKDLLSTKRGYEPFLLIVLLFSIFLSLLILRPFAQPIILAIVLASLFYPIYLRLLKIFKGRQLLAALAVIVLITFLIFIPATFFLSALFSEGADSVSRINAWVAEGNLETAINNFKESSALAWVINKLDFVDLSQIDIQGTLMDASKSIGQILLSKGAGFLGNLTNLVTSFVIMIFITFWFLKDGPDLLTRVKYLSPLPDGHEDRIFERIRLVARSVFIGSFLTALCQGVAGGIGLAIVGIPALFWGSVMAVTSLIPVVGTALVWVPAALYLVIIGKWGWALFLAIWSIIVVGSIDNFLRPYFMKGQAEMSPFLLFLAILGGVQYFGLIGLLYGPLIISFAAVMLYIYSIEFKHLLDEGAASTE